MPSHEKQKAPAYQWYLKDWRSSRATQRMSFSERGVYREMLDEQWETLTLPDSPEDVADLIATTDAQRAEVLAAWPVVRLKFASLEGHRIQNLRMERGRKERRKFVREKQAAGQHSVARAVRGPNGTFQQHANSPTNTSTNSTPTSHRPPAPTALQPSSASAFASASASATASAEHAGARVLETFRDHWKTTYGYECSLILKPLEYMQLEQQVDTYGDARLHTALAAYFATDDPYVRNAKHPLALFLRDPNKYLAIASAPPTNASQAAYEAKCRAEAEAVLKLVQQDDAKKAAQR